MDQREHDVDPTTIYRILDKLEQLHLVHGLQGKFIRCSFPTDTKKKHHFLVCEKCKNAEEILLDYHESIEKQLAQEKNYILREVEMYFWGICQNCSKK